MRGIREESGEAMSYHVEQQRFGELPDKIVVREDGYMYAHKNEGEPIVDYVYTLNGGDDKSRYAELFGTPERAMLTIASWCTHSDGSCAGCPVFGSDVDDCSDCDALLEWLKGGSE